MDMERGLWQGSLLCLTVANLMIIDYP